MEQESRITGLTHRNEQQPSRALIDACFTIVDTGALVYCDLPNLALVMQKFIPAPKPSRSRF
jgi:hypothetical protein